MRLVPRGAECQCGACGARLICLDPAEIGMVVSPRRGSTVWSFPGRDNETDTPSPRALRKARIARMVRKFGAMSPAVA